MSAHSKTHHGGGQSHFQGSNGSPNSKLQQNKTIFINSQSPNRHFRSAKSIEKEVSSRSMQHSDQQSKYTSLKHEFKELKDVVLSQFKKINNEDQNIEMRFHLAQIENSRRATSK